MLFKGCSLTTKAINFTVSLFLLFTLPLFASSPDEKDQPPLSSLLKPSTFEGKESVVLRKKGSLGSSFKKLHHLSPSWFTKKRRSPTEDHKEYQSLKADLHFQSQQVEWLEGFFEHGASSGILFRNADSKQQDFFINLKTLYKIELKFLPLLIVGEEANIKETELFPKLSKKIPSFMTASKQVFESFELIFMQAKEDLNRKQFYFDQFSEEFKTGKDTTTDVRSYEAAKGNAGVRAYTIDHTVSLIKQIYTQYHFFSKTLPTLQLIFEKQLFMGQKVEPFVLKGTPKKEFKQTYFYQTDWQSNIRKRMSTLLEDHQVLIGHLNSILSAHKENPVNKDPTLYEAKVSNKQTFSLFQKVIQDHTDEEWAKRLEEEFSEVEYELDALIKKTATLLRNPDSKDIDWKEPAPLLKSSSSGKIFNWVKPERKNSGQKLSQLKRTLSRKNLEESHEEAPLPPSGKDFKKERKKGKKPKTRTASLKRTLNGKINYKSKDKKSE